MNDKERMETIVLLNTILDEYDDHYMTGINGRAKPSHHNIWDVTEEIMDAGIPLTDEYKRKVDVYYNSLSKPTQNKRSGQYKRIKDYITEERTDFSLLKKNENLPVFLTARGIEGFEITKSELDVPADLTTDLNDIAADLAVDAAVAENEPKQLSPFEKFEDDLTELYLIRGYNDQLQNYVNGQLYFADEQKIEDYLRFARKSSKPVTVTDLEEYVAPAAVKEENLEGVGALFEEEVGPGVMPLEVVPVPEVGTGVVPPEVADPEIIAGDLSDAGTQVSSDADLSDASTVNNDDQSKEAVSNGNLERPYIKRYHETSLKLYFQNSSFPDWDHVLEANIMDLKDLTKFERIEMMDDVIKEYGNKLFIKERKSDTLEELNELVQLQFCILRNLHLGNRSKTASIKLSELANLANAASSSMNNSMNGNGTNNSTDASGPGPGPDQTVPQVNGKLTTEPRQQTRSEAQKNKDMDRLQHLTNLSLVPVPKKEAKSPFIKGSQDQHTLGLIPGNGTNIKVEKGRVKKTGLVRLNKN